MEKIYELSKATHATYGITKRSNKNVFDIDPFKAGIYVWSPNNTTRNHVYNSLKSTMCMLMCIAVSIYTVHKKESTNGL